MLAFSFSMLFFIMINCHVVFSFSTAIHGVHYLVFPSTVTRSRNVVYSSSLSHDSPNTLIMLYMSKNQNNNAFGENEDFQDFSQDEVEAANDLAKEFYKQMKKREEASTQQPQQETWEIKNNSSSSSTSTSTTNKKNRKFTGRYSTGDLDSTGAPSAGLFATQNGTVYAIPGKRQSMQRSSSSSEPTPARDRIMRQEFNLVSAAANELTILIQAAIIVGALSFALYIGATGGITDGSDRFGAGEGIINEYNGMGEDLDLSNYISDETSISSKIEDAVKDKSFSVWL